VDEKNAKSAYHLYVIRTRRRERLKKGLIDRGIGTGVHYPKPAHLQKAFSFLGYRKGDFPLSEMLSKEVLSLPLFPELKEQELRWVIESVNSILGAE
jgi:dTDP-4-amino-4,6-dideoxygalactose transaminase